MTESRVKNVLHRQSLTKFIAALVIASSWCGRVSAGKLPDDASALGKQPPTRQNGVAYTKGVHGDLLADLYLPAQPGPRPAVVYLHGGAWKGGDRSQLETVAISLAEAGYVGMAVDYDTTDKGDRFPLAMQEAERAVGWLREHAAQYGVAPDRIAVAGSSAGGELAALIGLDADVPRRSKVQAVVVFNGVLDLSYVGPDAEVMVEPYLGGSCSTKHQECRRASPVAQVRAGAPPFFVGHGTADRIVPYSQARHFVKLLRDKHVAVTPFVAHGAGHTYWKADAWFQPNLSAVNNFLRSAMPEMRVEARLASQADRNK